MRGCCPHPLDDAHGAPLLDEALCVLLEVRAHVDVHAAQLDRLLAQRERLDARVSTLEGAPERRETSARARGLEPTTAARGRPPTLLDLSADALDRAMSLLDRDDELAAALACRTLRDAVARARTRSGGASPPRPLTTCVRSLAGSWAQLQWGVAYAGSPLSPMLLAHLAGLGDLRMLSWLRARGCAWPALVPLDPSDGRLPEYGGPCARSARGGHRAVLQWLRASGCPWDARTCAQAAGGGHLAVLQWARANGCPWNEKTCESAAEGGHLAVLQWARANGCPWDEGTCSFAAGGDHLAVLQWARANGCPWDSEICCRAARSGHLAMLQWARNNGCPWDGQTCSWAAGAGHLAVLQWARANGCPWGGRYEGTCESAAEGGHLAVLECARANGCPWDENTCASAAGSGHLAVLQWARANGCPESEWAH